MARFEDSLDLFGIRKLYPTATAGPAWDSAHWSNGRPRSIPNGGRDADDPTGVSQARGNGTVTVDGDGVLTLGGWQPRIYLNAPSTHFFKNVEMTVYYQRVSDDGAPWGGLVMAARSGPDGHTSDPCDAHTYYARLRHDGRTDFAKELQHPRCSVRNSQHAWNGSRLPCGRWIGMKFVAYNVNGGRHVKLEQYRDATGGRNGGTWEKINETVDPGEWAPPSSCGLPSDFIPLVGGGVSFIRNTAASEARYKWFTVREIDARSSNSSDRDQPLPPCRLRTTARELTDDAGSP